MSKSLTRMTARSVVLSVLLGARPAWASAAELVRLTNDFGIKEATLRVALTRMVSTVFDGVARHTPEGHAFVADAVEHGFRDAVRHRDEPFGDHGRRASQV